MKCSICNKEIKRFWYWMLPFDLISCAVCHVSVDRRLSHDDIVYLDDKFNENTNKYLKEIEENKFEF